MYDLKKLLPWYYDGVIEFENIMETENESFSILESLTDEVSRNQFVNTSNEKGIILFEDMLNIVPNVALDSLSFRRERVINRLSMTPPFSLGYLKSKLNEIIGVGAWTLNVDYDNYTIYVESTAANQSWAQEIQVTMGKIKPANMVYINKPVVTHDFALSEGVKSKKITRMYKLGKWKIGQGTFVIEGEEESAKLPEIRSTNMDLLRSTAGYISNIIHYVVINHEHTIYDIRTTSVEVDDTNDTVVATIQYTIPYESGIESVTNIQLCGKEGIFTDTSMYVPILDETIMKHTIRIREGV